MRYASFFERLVETEIPHPEVLSVYYTVPLDPAEFDGVLPRVEHLVRQAAADSGSRITLADLRDTLAATRDWLGRGVAMFVAGANGLFERLKLPAPVDDTAMVGTRPYVRPLIAIGHRCPRYGIAVVDEAHAWIWPDDEPAEITAVTDEALRKPNYAGWYGLSEYGVRSRAEGLRIRHYRRAAAEIRRFMRREGLDLLVLCGHDYEIPVFMEELPVDMRSKVSGVVAVDPRTLNPANMKPRTDPVIARRIAEYDENLAAAVVSDAATEKNAVTGLARCLAAVNARAVGTLLLDDGIRIRGAVCRGCGNLLEAGERACPDCDADVRAVPDVLEEAAVAVLRSRGKVVPLPSGLLDGGPVAARLRMPIAVFAH
ncbi:Stalled ribosome rescue protein Dom34, pelota family [Sinosporangium album]|uniref:Stalled ribosome rescue protein Dom34, pelota family n=1 Tax=Sinosporangium album TaxID=504805 RepID=A0A1G8BD83_9ACTN|nr:hypothetical protein [Sinosporangium album]SDH30983.1 Stalled ribosome rescue protein Dom34, pelota family [Sinosporangium album]